MRDNRREKVMVAYTFGSITPEFHVSLLRLQHYDVQTGQRFVGPHSWHCAVGTTNIADGRNKAVQSFLEDPAKPDWLWFVDTDQEFEPDILERMIESADPVERPILSALVMANRPERARPIAPACVVFNPDGLPIQPPTIPNERHWPVAAIGCGCVLFHRSVLEKVGAEFKDKTPFPWFEFSPWKRIDDDGNEVLDILGEDYTACARAHKVCGVVPVVDTTIEAGHVKKRVLYSRDFWAQLPREAIDDRTFVIIPSKSNLKDLKALCRDLFEQGGYSELIVLDNGYSKPGKEWLARQTFARVVSAEGKGIHQMWNAGALYALQNHPKVNIVFLNDDLRIGPHFIKGLRNALRDPDHPMMAVSPNYDGRPGEGVQPVKGISAYHYWDPESGGCTRTDCDAEGPHGGLSGFAFAVRGELFQQGYRFPEVCKWWYGDNDLCLAMDAAGLPYGVVIDTTVEHLDGGSKTGNWDDPAMQAQLAADGRAWQEHLRKLGLTVSTP